MARAPLLQLNDVSLTFGGDPLLNDISVVVQQGDRLALVGRNGSGKSTLMKVMAGLVETDSGQRILPPGQSVGYMEQDPDMSRFATLGEFATDGLDPGDHYKVEMASEGLKFDPDRPVSTASGGEKRRAALARLMAFDPALMLLDEPTNHLDIHAISWLEDQLSSTRQSFILISHDRMFLRQLTRGTLWIDRGKLRRSDSGFEHFEGWRDTVWDKEDVARHKLNRKIAQEARWAVEGISARRKRNQGRVRALQELRAERSAQIRRQGTAAMALEAGPQSGRKVIEAQNVSLQFGDTPIIRDLNLTIQRKDRVALVGPNGVGKTTLLNILMKTQEPDSGVVKHGTNLVPALFDQTRAQLDPNMTLWDSLIGDPDMRVSGNADQVMVRGTPRHVVGYLKEYLFDDQQARAPVRSLSGGEKARLLLAKLMARESNLLILDEPTNDLDIESLDLLQEVLDGFEGTVLLVSHDRDFLDRVATTTIVMEGAGQTTLYAGGWSDSQAQSKASKDGPNTTSQEPKVVKPSTAKGDLSDTGGARGPVAKMTFKDQHRLKTLPVEIERLEGEIIKLQGLLSDPTLYTVDHKKFTKATKALQEREAALSEAEEDWLRLAEAAEQR